MRRRTRSRTAVLAVALLAAGIGGAAQKKPQPRAIVAGTVFRDPGFAFPDVDVALTRKDDPKAKKLQQAVTNYRGEFAFDVPPVEATYVVRATHKGFHPDQKEAMISGVAERIEVTLTLSPESK